MEGADHSASGNADRDRVRDWYDERYARAGREAMRPQEAYVTYLDFLGVEPGRRLLDVSCGTGHLLRAAADRGLETCGVDLSTEAVCLARRVSPASLTLVGDAEALAFASGAFDYVTCLGSLEHFPHPERALAEMKRVARRDATFCIVVPNSRFLPWRWLPAGTEQREVIENPRSLDGWRALFATAGFRLAAVARDPWYLKRPRARRSAARWLERAAYRVAWHLLPLGATYQLQFRLETA